MEIETSYSPHRMVTRIMAREIIDGVEYRTGIELADEIVMKSTDAMGYAIEKLKERLRNLSEDKPMTQLLPKDILVHLEKGDRTEEFVDPKVSPQMRHLQSLQNAFLQDQSIYAMSASSLYQNPTNIDQQRQRGGPVW